MSKISCDICLDLIPLVKDNVASEDSRATVLEHIEDCVSCRSVFEDAGFEEPKMDERRVLTKIKNRLYIAALVTVVLGALLGLALSDGAGMFYNILIMPAIGAIGYLGLGKKSFFIPPALFIFVYIWYLIRYAAEGALFNLPFLEALAAPLSWSPIYCGLCCLGIFIAFLLKFAFRKEAVK